MHNVTLLVKPEKVSRAELRQGKKNAPVIKP